MNGRIDVIVGKHFDKGSKLAGCLAGGNVRVDMLVEKGALRGGAAAEVHRPTVFGALALVVRVEGLVERERARGRPRDGAHSGSGEGHGQGAVTAETHGEGDHRRHLADLVEHEALPVIEQLHEPLAPNRDLLPWLERNHVAGGALVGGGRLEVSEVVEGVGTLQPPEGRLQAVELILVEPPAGILWAQAIGGEEVLILPGSTVGVRAEGVGRSRDAEHEDGCTGEPAVDPLDGSRDMVRLGFVPKEQLHREDLADGVHSFVGSACSRPPHLLQVAVVRIGDAARFMDRICQCLLHRHGVRVLLQPLILRAIVRDHQHDLALGTLSPCTISTLTPTAAVLAACPFDESFMQIAALCLDSAAHAGMCSTLSATI
mmetsp:Transcript_20751/g.44577  ORF Transcript_20751/g.44577 Transcript_20751/m.44577 type:complete len:373 (+) Transcript_20751:404-1522(+)